MPNYGGFETEMPTALCLGANGNLWLGGMIGGFYNETNKGNVLEWFDEGDAWVLQVDTNGNIINQRTIGTNNTEYLDCLYPLDDGTVIAAGRYNHNTNLPHPSTVPHTPGFPLTNNGEIDVFIAHLSPEMDLSTKTQSKSLATWQIYPNPSDGNIIVTIEGKVEKYTINISDMSGKLVYTGKLKNNKLEIDTKAWVKGIYTVTLYQKNQLSETKKLTIKQQP